MRIRISHKHEPVRSYLIAHARARGLMLHQLFLGAHWGNFTDEYGAGSLTYDVGAGPCASWESLPLHFVGNVLEAAFVQRQDGPECALMPEATAAARGLTAACSLPDNTRLCFVVEADNHHGHSTRRRSDGFELCSNAGILPGVVADRAWASATALTAASDVDYVAERKVPSREPHARTHARKARKIPVQPVQFGHPSERRTVSLCVR